MNSVLIRSQNKADMALLISLAQKLGMNTKSLTKAEIEDWHLAQKIESGMKTKSVSRDAILKELSK
jgi:hypothetical protein